MGLLGVTVPEEQGGLGLGYLEHTIAMEGECPDVFGQHEDRALTDRRAESGICVCCSELWGKSLRATSLALLGVLILRPTRISWSIS